MTKKMLALAQSGRAYNEKSYLRSRGTRQVKTENQNQTQQQTMSREVM
jgi:hypothetical protein